MKRILLSLSVVAFLFACGEGPGTESPGYVDSSNVAPNGTVNPDPYGGTPDTGTGMMSDTSTNRLDTSSNNTNSPVLPQ